MYKVHQRRAQLTRKYGPSLLQTRRPRIDAAHPRKWTRPLKDGVIPAYDEALKYLKKDSVMLKIEANRMRREVKALAKEFEQNPSEELDQTLEKRREKLNILEVQSEINLPEVRWRVANAMSEYRILFSVSV